MIVDLGKILLLLYKAQSSKQQRAYVIVLQLVELVRRELCIS
jgi:hypothetical protein